MWIVPKTLSHFVPDTEGLNLELDERAWILEQSAMWRSKPSSKQTWLRRLKKGGWITPLSTRILKPSLHQSFEEKYTEFVGATLVSPSPARGSEKEKKTQDTYGRISESTSGQLDLFGAFSRTSEVTSRWGYGESCPIWKKMVTERSGACSARRKRARLTNASDASSLRNYPTPEAHTVEKYSLQKDGQKKTQRSRNLTAMAINGELDNWATPQASDHVEGARTAKESNQKCLGRDLNQMENWPTPTAMSRPRSEETMEKCLKYRKSKGKNSVPLYLEEKVQKEQNWPTPRAGNPGSRKPGTGGKILAEEAKKNWATPTTQEAKNVPYHGKKGERPNDLTLLGQAQEAQKNWGTPRGSMANSPTEKQIKLGAPAKKIEDQVMCEEHNGPPAPEKSNTSGKNHGSPKLNPNWVESLMLGRGMTGWTQLPTEWTDSDS